MRAWRWGCSRMRTVRLLIGRNLTKTKPRAFRGFVLVELLGRYSNPSKWDKVREVIKVRAAGHGNRPDPLPWRVVLRPSAEELAEMATAYRDGMSLREMVVRFGWSRHALARYLRRQGVELRPKGTTKRPLPPAAA